MKLTGLFHLVLLCILIFVGCRMEKSEAPNPVHNVAIKDVKVSSTCSQGETVPVTVSVANKGSYREMFRLILTDTKNGKKITSKEMALAKGWKDGSEGVADAVFDAGNTGINYFGNQVWMERDINRDGFDDVLISATNWNSNTGRVFLYYGRGNEAPSMPDVVLSGEDPNNFFGNYSGICSGDLNGDGYEDIIISAR